MKPKLGVFWFGKFMEFFTPHISKYFEIYVYDTGKRTQHILNLWATPATLKEAATCEYVLLWYPAKYLQKLVGDIAWYIQKDATVFDICSVKTLPATVMLEFLPENCNIIVTHPIFWPQSGKETIVWLKMMLANIRSTDEKYDFLKHVFGEKMQLEIYEMTPEEHDREMAYIQWVTHFIGRTLKRLAIPKAKLSTLSYDHLREASEMVGYDSDELFLSIQQDNMYVADIRKKIIQEFETQNDWIQDNIK